MKKKILIVFMVLLLLFPSNTNHKSDAAFWLPIIPAVVAEKGIAITLISGTLVASGVTAYEGLTNDELRQISFEIYEKSGTAFRNAVSDVYASAVDAGQAYITWSQGLYDSLFQEIELYTSTTMDILKHEEALRSVSDEILLSPFESAYGMRDLYASPGWGGSTSNGYYTSGSVNNGNLEEYGLGLVFNGQIVNSAISFDIPRNVYSADVYDHSGVIAREMGYSATYRLLYGSVVTEDIGSGINSHLEIEWDKLRNGVAEINLALDSWLFKDAVSGSDLLINDDGVLAYPNGDVFNGNPSDVDVVVPPIGVSPGAPDISIEKPTVPYDDVYVGSPDVPLVRNPADADVGNPDIPADTPLDWLTGTFTGLWAGLLDLIRTIIGLLESILAWLNGLISALIDAITDMLVYLFVPSVAISETFQNLRTTFNAKFPDLPKIVSFIGALQSASCTSLSNLSATIFGQHLTIVNFDYLRQASNWFRPIMSGFIWLLVLAYGYKKITAVIGNGDVK